MEEDLLDIFSRAAAGKDERSRMDLMHLLGKACDEIKLLRKLLGESARREGDANGHVSRLQHRINQLSN